MNHSLDIKPGYTHAYHTKDLFHRIKYKGLNRLSKRRNKSIQEACAEIFDVVLSDIILDVIENNVTFVLPLDYGKWGELSIKAVTDEDFKEHYREGFFGWVDFVKSNFTGYYLVYQFKNRNGEMRTRWVRTTGHLFDVLKEHTNSGKGYY